MKPPLLYGHRGAPREEPENTLPSFRRALELGADVLEMDLHLTSDGHVVVAHDVDGRRLAGVAARIDRTTLADVRRWDAGRRFVGRDGRPFAGRGYRIPTFEEVLVELPGVPLNVDLKQGRPSMVEPVLSLLRRLGAEERVTLACLQRGPLDEARRRRYRGRIALARPDVLQLALLPLPLLRRLPPRGDVAQLPTRFGPLSLGRRGVVAKCHEAGVPVDFWVVNEPAEAGALLSLEVDGIMTDDLAAIAPLLRRGARERVGPGAPGSV